MASQGFRIFAQGRGPGPYNVGLEWDDGTKQVVTYRRYKQLMAEAQYASAEGFVQFEPVEREANSQTVMDYTIKTPGTDGVLIRVTVWPELQGADIQKGDWIAVDGKLNIGSFTGRDGETRQSIQISATALAVVKAVPRAERQVVNKGSSKKASSQNAQNALF